MSRPNTGRFVNASRRSAWLALLLCSFLLDGQAQHTDGATPSTSPALLTQEVQDTPRPAPPGRGPGVLARLNLSPEQRWQIRRIREQAEQERRTLNLRQREARRALDMAIYGEQADEGLVEARVQELAAAQSALMRWRASTEFKLRRVLTPAQLNVFLNLRRQARARREQKQLGELDPRTGLRNGFTRRARRQPKGRAAGAPASPLAPSPPPSPPRERRQGGGHLMRQPRP